MESVYQRVTNSIIAELKQGIVPWVRPWKSSASPFPRNVISQRPYRGVNVLLLWAPASSQGYGNPGWLTFRQARGLGGSVKQGEQATAIVYAAKTTKVAANDSGEEVEKEIRFLKFYSVFNVEQTTGLPDRYYGVPTEKPLGQRHVHAELFLGRIGAIVRHGGDNAYYSPEQDIIVLPKRDDFESLRHYYATSLHEHVHYSGHPKRLHRDLKGRFGSRSYAGEELVAELGAAFLCSKLEIEGELRHAAYIASWLELLQDDSRAIFTAASAASKAADYLCSFSEKSLPTEAAPA
ncbi:MAG: ArdC family protein [Casimicrobiaceae bacterium]